MKENRGRRRKSPLSRAEQTREAQRRFRRRMQREGKFPMQAYVDRDLVQIVDADAKHRGETRGDRVEWALRRAFAKTGGRQ
ncbi:MAG: hypothetical protein KF715_19935 [Candidatus Didemnitutus sp.]|nr:hypothetical protein [Candidatus Didemnitutus sp.]